MKHRKPYYWTLAALLFLTWARSSSLAQTTNIIAQADFDSYTINYTYGYTYAGGDGGVGWADCSSVTISTSSNNAPFGVEVGGVPSQALLVTMDYSALPDTPIWTNSLIYTYSGFGAATLWGIWNLDASGINSINPAAYIFSCDIRAFGMANTAPIKFTLAFEAPDGTLDSGDGHPDILLQAEYSTVVSSNFTHIEVSFNDNDMVITGGSMSNLYNYAYAISDFSILAVGDPAVPSFGTDADNGFVVDNYQVVSIYTPPTPPTVPLTILDWNMDDHPLTYNYGGYNWSGNSYLPLFTYSANNTSDMAGYGVGGSNAWWLQMDNSALAAPNTPPWAGGGTGGAGPFDLSLFTDNVLKSYVLECDARVEGLAPDATNTSVDCQLFLDSPGGNVRLDFNVPAASNWVHSAINFNTASWNTDDGRLPKASFATNYNTYTDLRIQWQIANAQDGATWGFDSDNRLVADNITLVHYVIGCPPLSIFTATNNLIVTWNQPSTGTAILLSGSNLTGVTDEVVGASSPYVIPIAGAPKYFRTQWVP